MKQPHFIHSHSLTHSIRLAPWNPVYHELWPKTISIYFIQNIHKHTCADLTFCTIIQMTPKVIPQTDEMTSFCFDVSVFFSLFIFFLSSIVQTTPGATERWVWWIIRVNRNTVILSSIRFSCGTTNHNRRKFSLSLWLFETIYLCFDNITWNGCLVGWVWTFRPMQHMC